MVVGQEDAGLQRGHEVTCTEAYARAWVGHPRARCVQSPMVERGLEAQALAATKGERYDALHRLRAG